MWQGSETFKVIIICSKYLLKKVANGGLVELTVLCGSSMQDKVGWHKVSLKRDLGQVKQAHGSSWTRIGTYGGLGLCLPFVTVVLKSYLIWAVPSSKVSALTVFRLPNGPLGFSTSCCFCRNCASPSPWVPASSHHWVLVIAFKGLRHPGQPIRVLLASAHSMYGSRGFPTKCLLRSFSHSYSCKVCVMTHTLSYTEW